MKLGRKAIKTDSRTLRLARYMTEALPPAPVSVDWTKGQTNWGMMLNDRLGCCTIAGSAHAIQVWTAELGSEVTLSDNDVLTAYEVWDGYNPNDPSTDQGGIELDVLTDWQKQGFANHKLLAFASINPANLSEVHTAINLFGGVYIGVSLPITAQSQDIWDVTSLSGDGEPGSWGGHCVYVPKYDQNGLTCITWGAPKTMTNAFWNAYVDESYALLGADWIGVKGSPLGFDLASLQADLSQIR